MYPDDIKYHREHIWVKVMAKEVTIGITDYAVSLLGDIVYIELPEIGADVDANTEIAEIESEKTTLSIISPVSGVVTEVNEELSTTPEMLEENPYEDGWIAVIEIDDDREIDELMDTSEYEEYLEREIKLR